MWENATLNLIYLFIVLIQLYLATCAVAGGMLTTQNFFLAESQKHGLWILLVLFVFPYLLAFWEMLMKNAKNKISKQFTFCALKRAFLLKNCPRLEGRVYIEINKYEVGAFYFINWIEWRKFFVKKIRIIIVKLCVKSFPTVNLKYRWMTF